MFDRSGEALIVRVPALSAHLIGGYGSRQNTDVAMIDLRRGDGELRQQNRRLGLLIVASVVLLYLIAIVGVLVLN